MTPERWRQVSRLYEAARACPAAERTAFLTASCESDAALCQEVQSLLDQPTSLPVVERLTTSIVAHAMEDVILTGRRFGAYLVGERIGSGGMGNVYRARDTQLRRNVAIKVLHHELAHDPERLTRFEQEARLLAALNHPNIATIYGLEDTGDAKALVMELVEGPTLADRIATGPIALGEAIPIARQITEALAAAHEQGIIHRDLKPANVKVRADGTVKVLDFGLAKTMEPTAAAKGNVQTLSLFAPTTPGMIVGTVSYMSPEQASGKPVDKRTDLWAFGVVLAEMLTGRRVFDGETVSHVLSSVLTQEPDWTMLPADTPASIRRMLRRCLEKDRTRRLESAADARLEIDDAFETSAALALPAPTQSARWRRRILAAATLVVSIALTSAAWLAIRPASAPLVRTEITTAGDTAFASQGNDRNVAITPDGRRIVYRGDGQLLVRALDALVPTALTGLGNPRAPFVSPDGLWVGFFDDLEGLKKVRISGGAPLLVTTGDGSGPRGATWLADGTIIYARAATTATGLLRVSAAGGVPTVLTRPHRASGEAAHWWPAALPGGKAVLFTIMDRTGGVDAAQIALLDLQSGKQTVLLRGGHHAMYVPSGHLVYGSGGSLHAVAFDLATRTVTGTPVSVIDGVATTLQGAVDAIVSATGTLVYVPGTLAGPEPRSLLWVDRQGREASLHAPGHAYQFPRVSPDGTRIALYRSDLERDLWLWDVSRSALSRLTFETETDSSALWTSDGQQLVFASQRDGAFNLYEQAADGTGKALRLTRSTRPQIPTDVTADGTRVVFNERTAERGMDLRLLTLPAAIQGTSTTAHVEALLETRFNERDGVVSPDGRWLAYAGDSSGRWEIYVRPFPPGKGGLWPISTVGGSQPLWARSGRELYYRALEGALMAVPVTASENAWRNGTPVQLFATRYFGGDAGQPARQYDVTADGQRFLLIKDPSESATAPMNLTIVLNWLDELKRVAPPR